jgi:hypothetical protein
MKPITITPIHKKAVLTVLLVVLGALAYWPATTVLLDKSLVGKLDAAGNQKLDDALERAIYTFAVVRGINGVISVIQNTRLSISPAGLGVSLAAGEILDPVDDLLERFSWVMLVSTTSLGIQKVLLAAGKWFGVHILLTGALAILSVGIWISTDFCINFKRLGSKLLIFALVIRFCIPLISLVSDKLYLLFLEDTYHVATQSLNQFKQDIVDAAQPDDKRASQTGETNLVSRVKQYYEDAGSIIHFKEKMDALKDKITEYAKHTINLITVFLLQTVLFPIVVLWLLIKMCKFLFDAQPQYPVLNRRVTGS